MAIVAETIGEAKPGDVAALVRDRIAYLDTLHVWFEPALNRHHIRFVKQYCGHIYPEYRAMSVNTHWRCKMVMHRPTDAALEFLDDLNHEKLVQRVDFALDLIANESWHVTRLEQFVKRCWIKRWNGKNQGCDIDGTTYSASKHAPNVQVLYADKPSKISGQPCVHLEWRCMTADACKRAGVASLSDLIDCDHHAFWAKRLVLRNIDAAKLGYEQRRVGRRCAVPNVRDRRAGRVLMRIVDGRVQGVKDAKFGLTYKQIERCLSVVSNEPFLPE